KLNGAFGINALRLSASVTGDNTLQVTGSSYGSATTIKISFALDGVVAAQQFGFGAGLVSGTNVAGTIDGKAATGRGQLLTANAPAEGETANAQGLSVLFTGTAPATTNVKYVLGVGGMLVNS